MRTILVLAVLSLTPSTTFAQDDTRWLPWLGCWQSPVERLAGDSARVCMVPSGSGVKMLTVVGDETSTDQTIVADSTDRALDEPSCTGVSRAEWSRDGTMLFTRGELACENRPGQKVSGLHLFTSGPAWIDIQVVEAAGRDNARTRRYERVSVPASLADVLPSELMIRAARAAQQAADAPLAVKDIIEARGKVASAGIEAALFETKTQFALNSRALIALHDAGVTANVIDLMLAISYPSHFAVNRWSPVLQAPQTFYGDAEWDDWSFSRPLWSSHRFSRFGFYQSPYSYYSGWNLSYFPRGDSNAPAGSFTVSPPPGTEDSGSVVKGHGYTRGRPSDPGSAATFESQASSTADRSSASSSDGSQAGSSSGASPAGYSSGSSGGSGGGDSGGRTAVARE